MSNLKDFKNKNTEFTGEVGIDLPEGATSTRVNEQGRLRFNTETGLAEYYNGTIWKSIDAPPAVSSADNSHHLRQMVLLYLQFKFRFKDLTQVVLQQNL